MSRKILFMLAVGVLAAVMAGSALAQAPPDEQGVRPSSPAEFVPEGNWSGTDWQVGVQAIGEIETGAVPEVVFEESWMREYGRD